MEFIKTVSNNSVQVLYNLDIINIVFSKLELNDLKNIRSVCRLWSIEALNGFRNKILVHHNPSLLQKVNPHHITQFLVHHEISYALIISFLNIPWYYCNINDDYRIQIMARWKTLQRWVNGLLYKKYLTQRNNMKYIEVISKSFFESSCAAHLTELRIELNIFHEKDSELLVATLSKTLNLETLALDFVSVKKAEVKTLPEELLVPLNKLKLLSLRCDSYAPTYSESEIFDLECWTNTKILGLFPGIKFLDLYSWQQGLMVEQEHNREFIPFCREALQLLHNQKQYFQSLEGWRFDKLCCSSNETLLFPFPPQLKYLVIRGSENEKEILSYELPSLRRCELLLDYYEDPNLLNMNISSLPKLEYLGLCTGLGYEDYDIEKRDILKIREIILSENFKWIFPSLHTLNIAVSFQNDKEFFNYIFPTEVEIEIYGIKSFGTSLSADCESEEITRFYSMFPDLEILKHVREIFDEEVDCSVICIHKKDNDGKNFFRQTSNLRKIIKDPYHPNCFNHINVIYQLLRGTLFKEPFFWKCNDIECYTLRYEDNSDTTEIHTKNCFNFMKSCKPL